MSENIAALRSRRAEIINEQAEIANKHRLSEGDKKRFEELQTEFLQANAKILKHEADNGLEQRDGIRPVPEGSTYTSGGPDTQPGAEHRAWGRQVATKIMEARGIDVSASGVVTPPFFDPRLRSLPWGALSVRALIPSVQVDTATVHAVRQKVGATGRDNNSTAVAHGDEKPESIIGLERVDVTVRTIAHVSEPIEIQILEDFEGLASFVGEELRNGVLQATEDLIINGDGTGVEFAGLLNQTTQSVTVGALTELDTIYSAIDTVRANFYEPDAIVLSQTDAQTIRQSKDNTDGYLMGDPSQAGAETLFGKRLVVSPLMPAGTGLVRAFAQGATIYDGHEPRIAWATSGLAATGEDLFLHNQLRARAEERLAFVVTRPAAFCEIDFTP